MEKMSIRVGDRVLLENYRATWSASRSALIGQVGVVTSTKPRPGANPNRAWAHVSVAGAAVKWPLWSLSRVDARNGERADEIESAGGTQGSPSRGEDGAVSLSAAREQMTVEAHARAIVDLLGSEPIASEVEPLRAVACDLVRRLDEARRLIAEAGGLPGVVIGGVS